jgi:hypothetical protein
MTVQLKQDLDFIARIRTAATIVLDASNNSTIAQSEWVIAFGGVTRLGGDSFTESPDTGNSGLSKADISAALGILQALNTWLDEPGENRRGYLQAISKV